MPVFDDGVLEEGFIGRTTRAQQVGKPPGDFQFIVPKMVIDGDGVVHMVWAEREHREPSARKDWPPHWRGLTALWHASYSDAEGWSSPAVILQHEAGIVWGDQFADFSLDQDGRPMLPVVLFPGQIALLRLEATWRMQQTSEESAYGYSRAAQLPDGTIFITYLGSDEWGSVGGENSIMLVQSVNDGRSWMPPTVIRRSNQPLLQNPQVFAGRGDTVHVLWTRVGLGGALFEGVEHVYTTDRGVTWQSTGDIPASSQRKDFQAASDRCGTLHVIFNSWRENEDDNGEVRSDQRILYTRWDGIWQDPELLFPDDNVQSPGLASDPHGSLYLFWSSVRSEGTGQLKFQPRMAVLRTTAPGQ